MNGVYELLRQRAAWGGHWQQPAGEEGQQ